MTSGRILLVMKLLILGGTRFYGRAIAEEALGRGHQVTLFHRGQSGRDLFPEATHVLGNRDGELDRLSGHTFDAVVDVCGYVPRLVRASAEFLRPLAPRYVFVSTISVYDLATPGLHAEDAPRFAPLLDGNEQITGETYGPLKVACEDVVEEVYGQNGFSIRPGYIIGPHDVSDRFTYWVARIGQGGEVAVPIAQGQPFQGVDARDLARYTVDQAEADTHGATHVIGPQNPVLLHDTLRQIREVLGSSAELVPVEGDLGFPLVSDPGGYPMLQMDLGKAFSGGLQLRPMAETIRDTWAWHQTREGHVLKVGPSAAAEAAAIEQALTG